MSEPTLLDALLQVIDAATDAGTDDGWGRPSTLWYAALDLDDVTIGHKEVDGHPYDHLVGFTAPPEWTVLGVTCCGWVGSLDADVPPSMQEGRRRVRQTFLVGRSGATAINVRFQDGGDPITEPPSEGRMVDALKRCMGLHTTPPHVDTSALFAMWWLDNLVAVGRRSPKRLTWKEACDQHPAVRLLRAAGERPLSGDAVLAGRALAQVFDWPRLREFLIESPATALVDPAVAAWMDEGMLCRYLFGQLPSYTDLVHEMLDHVTPVTGERLYHALESLLAAGAAA